MLVGLTHVHVIDHRPDLVGRQETHACSHHQTRCCTLQTQVQTSRLLATMAYDCAGTLLLLALMAQTQAQASTAADPECRLHLLLPPPVSPSPAPVPFLTQTRCPVPSPRPIGRRQNTHTAPTPALPHSSMVSSPSVATKGKGAHRPYSETHVPPQASRQSCRMAPLLQVAAAL